MKPMINPLQRRQRGAATLVVVMVLFLVMALLAAYANRSLLFEQRIAVSYFRGSLAQEVAEGGVEWTLAQLNGTATDTTCKPVETAGKRFADKYLQIDAADRRMTSKIVASIEGVIDCARDVANQGWACRCPAANAAHTPRAATGETQLNPGFALWLAGGKRGGTIELEVIGCTDSNTDTCGGKSGIVTANISKSQNARTRLNVLVALVSAVRNPPASPLIVKGNVEAGGDGLGLHNTDPRSAGMLAAMGGQWLTGMLDNRLESVPGSTTNQTIAQNDFTLSGATAEEVFRMFMGTSVARYGEHPAARKLTCDGDCAPALEAAYNAGQRIVWVDGPLAIHSNRVLGDVNDPLLIVVKGDVDLVGPFQLNGMLVSTGRLDWANGAAMPSLVNGIVLVGGDMATNGRVDIVYQQKVADQLRNRMGSYVRVPGGWTDVQQ